jgi:two-component system, NarL family, invasion response regulator UvrY
LADEPDMEVAGEASTGDETIAFVRKRTFVVVQHESQCRIKTVSTLLVTQFRPEQGVLALGLSESQYAINLLRAGANGYLNNLTYYAIKSGLIE